MRNKKLIANILFYVGVAALLYIHIPTNMPHLNDSFENMLALAAVTSMTVGKFMEAACRR